MALAHLHPEIVYTIHNGPVASPLAGVYGGTERVRDLAFSVLAEFDYLRYEPTIVSVDGDAVRAHVMFTLRHRESGCIIEGSRRIVIEMRGGLIGRYDLYEDGRRVEAFMRRSCAWPAGAHRLRSGPNSPRCWPAARRPAPARS